MIKVVKGSIFDKKCDLIIIPCNSMGGVSPDITQTLMNNSLPFFKKSVPAGDICFLDNTGEFANASVIGYAASVDVAKNSTSSQEVIVSIMGKIIDYCKDNYIQRVNIPLLGTGAGRLSYAKSFEVIKEYAVTNNRLQVFVHTLSDEIYNSIKTVDDQSSKNITNPRVFISYAGASPINKKWVKEFATRLRANGVDARIDAFHLRPGQDLPQWMTNELIMADKVLLICDPIYAEKADNRTGGVGWETMIIQGDMLANQNKGKYIAILRDRNIDRSLPIYAKSKYCLIWPDDNIADEEFKDLLYHLFDCENQVPPLGRIPLDIEQNLEMSSRH